MLKKKACAKHILKTPAKSVLSSDFCSVFLLPNGLGQTDFLKYSEPYTQDQVIISGVFKSIISYRNLKVTNSYVDWDNSCNVGTSGLSFDASLSNPIYGNATKVQPKSYQALIIIKT